VTVRTPIAWPTAADDAPDNGPVYRYWGSQKPPRNALILCQATPRLSADATKATIRLYGPIDPYGGFWGTSAKEVAAALDGLDDSVTELQLRINSPGGSAFEALAILNLLRAHPVRVTAVVDGLAASAASLIAAGCDETIMSPGTQMMVHGPSGLCWGTAADMRETADVLDKIAASMASIYAEAAGGKIADWVALMQKDTWYTAEEAVEAGLADGSPWCPTPGRPPPPAPEPSDDEASTTRRRRPENPRPSIYAAPTQFPRARPQAPDRVRGRAHHHHSGRESRRGVQRRAGHQHEAEARHRRGRGRGHHPGGARRGPRRADHRADGLHLPAGAGGHDAGRQRRVRPAPRGRRGWPRRARSAQRPGP
jgi:ATP-dependent protease ClpP protease subunit